MPSQNTPSYRRIAKARRIFLSAMAVMILGWVLLGLRMVLGAFGAAPEQKLPISIAAFALMVGSGLLLVLAVRLVRCPGCGRSLANVMPIFGSLTRVSHCPYCGYRLAAES